MADEYSMQSQASSWQSVLPISRNLYYGGNWHAPVGGEVRAVNSPGTGTELCKVAEADERDVSSVIDAARNGFQLWRQVKPLERAKTLRKMAAVIRSNLRELALLDAIDCGNPVQMLYGDVAAAAELLDFFAGLVTEMKGSSIPMGVGTVNFSTREPYGVVARIIPFNHPLLTCAGKIAAPLAAGNAVIIKPSEQSPLSALRLAELFHELLPPGVFNVVTGGKAVGAALSQHPGVSMITVVGSIPTGRAVMRAAAETIKPVLLELGGKNALIAFSDTHPDQVADAVIRGMNFEWCGQSCGSTSRAYIHSDIYEDVIEKVASRVTRFKPGIPSDPETTMGALISQAQLSRVESYVEQAKLAGARLIAGGSRPAHESLKNGCFFEATVFADVTMDMDIAREEIFGPVLSIIKWDNKKSLIQQVNQLDLGLTCSIWTDSLQDANQLAQDVEAGFVWINDVAKHFLGAPFGGVKQSGIGREECLGELLAFTREKNIHINFTPK
ncbi:TPA: aldehyde dehydrogenase family protein [Serratia marcescens]|uniref:aldehyde dehydrogenase family protein n=1 Tax=Serratia sp. CY38905 TaxID=3383613 RepID=UPI0029CFAF9D|nr:aldehyde dehydrogenase family protein [Serratia marcescens]HEI9757642.1 aldehyde dehydrogenase family protein [Serratia marcescens]